MNIFSIFSQLSYKSLFFLIFSLILKLIIVLTFNDNFAKIWYIPFINHALETDLLNPWSTWLTYNYGNLQFPYGHLMLALFIPLEFLFSFFPYETQLGYFSTLFIFDVLLFILIKKLFLYNINFLILFYWFNPIIIIPTYFFGFNDIIPLFFLVTSILFCKKNNFYLSGFFISIAIAIKLTFLISLPFFLIFYLQARYRNKLFKFVKGISIGLIIIVLQFFLTTLITEITTNSEFLKIYELKFNLGDNNYIYIVPIILIFLFYDNWITKRITFEMMYVYLFAGFASISIFSYSSPGWYIILVPFLLNYIYNSNITGKLILVAFNFIFTIYCLQFYLQKFFSNSNDIYLKFLIEPLLLSITSTAIAGIGLVIFFRMYFKNIKNSKFLSLRKKPFLVSIAGDSGSGKDTLTQSMKNILGNNSICQINGDDYHLYERKSPDWKVMTHLNPLANDLNTLSKNLQDLMKYKNILRKTYNHKFGKFDSPSVLNPKEFILVNSMHAYYLPIMRDLSDLKIYLDMDENLRQFFKIQRDVNIRGHSINVVRKNINDRKYDAKNFIYPQKNYADIIFRLEIKEMASLKNKYKNLKSSLKINIKIKSALYEEKLLTYISMIGNTSILKNENENFNLDVTIGNNIDKSSVELIASKVFEDLSNLIGISPIWEGGVNGIMQLFILSQLDQILSKRIFN